MAPWTHDNRCAWDHVKDALTLGASIRKSSHLTSCFQSIGAVGGVMLIRVASNSGLEWPFRQPGGGRLGSHLSAERGALTAGASAS